MKVPIQWHRFFYKMISAGNEPFAGSSIGAEGWQCETSMSRLSGESSLFLTFHLDRSLCGEACVALFCSATGCAGPASAFNWADECEARLTCWCRSDTHQPGLELDIFHLGRQSLEQPADSRHLIMLLMGIFCILQLSGCTVKLLRYLRYLELIGSPPCHSGTRCILTQIWLMRVLQAQYND